MLDFLPTRSWPGAMSEVDLKEPAKPRRGFLRRIGDVLPRDLRPLARRGLTGVSAHLPVGMRYRLYSLLVAMSREMGAFEQHYPAWIARHDRMDQQERRAIMARIARMPDYPLISILMPVFDPAPTALRAAVHSVQDQFYPWWELCIADDVSTDPAVLAVLREAEAGDHRIKLVRRERNGHISAASNSALKLATGRFVALLDHDDVLPPHALYEVATRILSQPEVDLLYSDEDHIGGDGQRHHPYFKPDWDPDLALGQNLVSHLGVYRRELVERVGGFREGFEGSQDYDLALRVAAASRPDRIAHIPKVLYHWRQGAPSRTFSEAAHERCVANARRAVSDVIGAGCRVEAAPSVPLWTRVVYPLPDPAPLVSVVLHRVGSDGEAACLRTLGEAYPALEVVAAAGLQPASRGLSVRLVEAGPPAAAARGTVLLFLDPDLMPLDAGWLRELVSQALRPEIGVVGARLLAPNGLVEHAGIALGGAHVARFPFVGRRPVDTGYFGHLQLVRAVSAVSAACLAVRRETFLQAGGIDPSLPRPLQEIDFCLKVSQLDRRTLWTPYATLRRVGEVRRPMEPDQRAIRLLHQRWGRKLDIDPYWNPNLSIGHGELGLAFPPRDQGTGVPQAA